MKGGATTFIVLGAIVFVISFIGFCGAIMENKKMILVVSYAMHVYSIFI